MFTALFEAWLQTGAAPRGGGGAGGNCLSMILDLFSFALFLFVCLLFVLLVSSAVSHVDDNIPLPQYDNLFGGNFKSGKRAEFFWNQPCLSISKLVYRHF